MAFGSRRSVPYTVREGDSLDAIAGYFPGADLVEVNAGMPGTIASGVTITVGTESVTMAAPVSFAEVCAVFGPPVDLAALAAASGPTCSRSERCWSARPSCSARSPQRSE
ncbi:hypothetical protein [Streptomyces sp. NBC_00272]|uniref:hypothetical protein n=1 Tax=Streptomyces sp. NBC_00272 TaxID=2975698 RepID=UPI002E2B9C11|nr:hypothetical protein [Streptomyces sp. NBC_00272]